MPFCLRQNVPSQPKVIIMIKFKNCIQCKLCFPIEDFKARQYFRDNKKIHISRDPRCTKCRLEYQRNLRRIQREIKLEEGIKPNSSLSEPAKDFLYGSK